jgi:hypothetical protein
MADARKVLFAAYDPGAKNHTRPLCEHAAGLGLRTEYVDLAGVVGEPLAGVVGEPLDEWPAALLAEHAPFDLLVCGCSTNACEFRLIEAVRRRGSVRTAMVAELGLSQTRITGLTSSSAPDLIVVTNEPARQTVAEKLRVEGAPHTAVLVGGSVHMENIARAAASSPSQLSRTEVLELYWGPPQDGAGRSHAL